MHGRKSRRLKSDGKLLKWLLKVSRSPRVFFYRSRSNRVLKALLETFYPNLLPLRKNVSLIYDGGLSSLIHQPFTGMVNPVRLGSHSDGTAIDVICSCLRNPTKTCIVYDSDFPVMSFTPPWCITISLMNR